MVRKKPKLFWQLIDSDDSSFQFVSGDACFTSRIPPVGADSGDSPFVPTRLVLYLGGPSLRNRPRAYKRPFSDFGPIKSRSNTPNSGSNRANSGSNTPKSKSNRFRNPSKTGFNRDSPAGASTLPTQAAQATGPRRSPRTPRKGTHPRSRSKPPEVPAAARRRPHPSEKRQTGGKPQNPSKRPFLLYFAPCIPLHTNVVLNIASPKL